MGTHDGTPGRPSLFTADVRAAVLLHLEQGHFRETAARLAGIARSTLKGWLKRGRDDRQAGNQTEFSAFLAAVEGAESNSEDRLLKKALTMAESGCGDGAMVRWLLERRFPRWNDRLMRRVREMEARLRELEKGNRAGQP